MKKFLIIFSFFAIIFGAIGFTSVADAATRVGGYYRSNGTYVMPHYRSSPNRSTFDNWSTKGNYNPYTGRKGYTDPYRFRL